MEQKTPKNLDELNFQLSEAFAWVRDDPRRAAQVKEMANVAGKILNGIKLKLVYAALRSENPEIEWLGKTSGKPLKDGAFLLKS
jgi:hypothetical protein